MIEFLALIKTVDLKMVRCRWRAINLICQPLKDNNHSIRGNPRAPIVHYQTSGMGCGQLFMLLTTSATVFMQSTHQVHSKLQAGCISRPGVDLRGILLLWHCLVINSCLLIKPVLQNS